MGAREEEGEGVRKDDVRGQGQSYTPLTSDP